MAIGLIQAFIFALLTVLYFGMASGHGGHEDGDHEEELADADDVTADSTQNREPELVA
jgi:F-type H+-transporting ATPase subunit a